MINTLLKRRMENTKKNKKGFTLVELIVVLVIIAILAAVLVPTVSGYIGKAKKTAAESALKSVITASQTAGTDCISSYNSVTAAVTDEYKKLSEDGNATTFNSIMSKDSGDTNIVNGVGIIVLDDATGTVVYATYSDGTYYAEYTSGSYKTGKGKAVSDLKAHTDGTGEKTVYTAS